MTVCGSIPVKRAVERGTEASGCREQLGESAHGSAGEHERIECFHRLALVVGQ